MTMLGRVLGALILVLLAGVAVSGPARLRVPWRATSRSRRRPRSSRIVLIVGTGERAMRLARWITGRRDDLYSVRGFVSEDPGRVGQVLAAGRRVVADRSSLVQCGVSGVDRVVVALDERRGALPLRELMELRVRGVCVTESSDFYEEAGAQIPVAELNPSGLVFSGGFRGSAIQAAVKRAVDVGGSLLLLGLAAPVLAAAAIAIKLDARGPVLFRQRRVGRNGKEFDLYRLRTMIDDAERHTGPTRAAVDDPRVTTVGKLLRRLSIDGLPQLANVLRGEMSLVGPRAERACFARELASTLPYYELRAAVRPGVTGWAQVRRGRGLTADEALERLQYDVYYVKHTNLLFDARILLETLGVAVARAAGTR
jgi:exopolysaccharide biosynthesis polyprenyl glycosylphosphotransferase